ERLIRLRFFVESRLQKLRRPVLSEQPSKGANTAVTCDFVVFEFLRRDDYSSISTDSSPSSSNISDPSSISQLPPPFVLLKVVPCCFRSFNLDGLITWIGFSLHIIDANVLSMRGVNEIPVL